MSDRLRRVAIVLLFVGAEAGVISRSGAQTANDPDFHFRNPAPAFPTGTGPVVCVDEAHHNAHTLEGRFGPFAGVLRSDGFRVRSSRLSFTRAALEACDIQAFLPSDKIEPLLSFGPDAAAYVLLGEMGQQLEEVPEEEWQRFSVRGWLAGASRRWGQGRVLVLGDISGCTAQRTDADGTRIGMNHPRGAQNAQFCLNAVRWLAGVLD